MRNTYSNYRPTGYYTPRSNTVIIYRDRYDNNFLQYATAIWLFHHWDTVDKSRFDEQRLRDLEYKMKQMERDGVKRDPNYVQPGVDQDLIYASVPAAVEKKTEKSGIGWIGWALLILFIIGVTFVGVWMYSRIRR
jgi:hypothetical protein